MNLSDPLVFIIFFAALWFVIGYVGGLISGWHELARAYRCEARSYGAQWKLQSGQMRFLFGLRNMLTVGVEPQGLYLATLWLFRVGYPPLFIPWQDVAVTPGKFLFWRYAEFRFRQAPAVFLRLPAKLAERMAAAVGDSWPVDRGAAVPF